MAEPAMSVSADEVVDSVIKHLGDKKRLPGLMMAFAG